MDRFKTVDAYLKAKSEWSAGLSVLREATKQSRLAKITPMILAGAGLNDRYRC
jgi:type IV secretory pathway TrbF-like protein